MFNLMKEKTIIKETIRKCNKKTSYIRVNDVF